MKKIFKYSLYTCFSFLIIMFIYILSISYTNVLYAASGTYTRQGDTVWLGTYPQTLATAAELEKMSTTPDENGYFKSGKDKFVKVNTLKLYNAYHNGKTDYVPFSDGSVPDPNSSYYFKIEPIKWRVLVDDEENNAVMLVSDQLLDAYYWLSSYEKSTVRDGWSAYDNTLEGVPEGTPANGWRYSEVRAFLNDVFYELAFKDVKDNIYLFSNTHTIDYRKDDPDTIVNDYVTIGNESDYNLAGNNYTPTDYAIVMGIHWQIDKNNCTYFVNEYPSMFPESDIRGFISSDHGQVLVIDKTHGLRPIIYAKRDTAKILATTKQKEANTSNGMLYGGIASAVIGLIIALPVMISTKAKYNKQKREEGTEYKLNKGEVIRLVPGLILTICGFVLIFLQISLFGGGFGGTKLKTGIYLQTDNYSGGGIQQVGQTAYRINSDGTFDYTDVYKGGGTIWSGHGTYKASGSTITFTWRGNPMVPDGYVGTAPIYSSTSFGNYKLIE